MKHAHDVLITGVHMELTQAIRDIVLEKVDKLFRHEHKIVRLRMELIHDHAGNKQAEFVAKGIISIHGPDIVVSCAGSDLYSAVDQLVEKLDRQLTKHAEIHREGHRNKGAD